MLLQSWKFLGLLIFNKKITVRDIFPDFSIQHLGTTLFFKAVSRTHTAAISSQWGSWLVQLAAIRLLDMLVPARELRGNSGPDFGQFLPGFGAGYIPVFPMHAYMYNHIYMYIYMYMIYMYMAICYISLYNSFYISIYILWIYMNKNQCIFHI